MKLASQDKNVIQQVATFEPSSVALCEGPLQFHSAFASTLKVNRTGAHLEPRECSHLPGTKGMNSGPNVTHARGHTGRSEVLAGSDRLQKELRPQPQHVACKEQTFIKSHESTHYPLHLGNRRARDHV